MAITFSDEKAPKAFNQLAREQMKLKLLNDILLDLSICELEGWDQWEYIKELIDLLEGLGRTNEHPRI